MRKEVKYQLVRHNSFKKYSSITLCESYKMSKKKDKESIGTIKFYDEKLIKMVIKKKLDGHFKKLITLMIKIEESDDDPSSTLLLALNETEKFKRELNNKYDKFLDKKQKEFINKKIEVLEKEIQKKIMTCQLMQMAKMKNYARFNEENDLEEERHHQR